MTLFLIARNITQAYRLMRPSYGTRERAGLLSSISIAYSSKNRLYSDQGDNNRMITKNLHELKSDFRHQRNDFEAICYTSQRIFGLLMDLTTDFSKLSYRKSSFHRVFRVFWIKSQFPKLPPKPRTEKQLREFVHKLTTFKFLNNSHKAATILRKLFANDNLGFIHSVKYSNKLIDFFLDKNDEIMIKRIFRRMEKENKKPNAMTFNLLGKHYLKDTNVVLERLAIWEAILLRMKSLDVKTDLCTYYISLSLMPTEVPAKQELKQLILSHGLHRAASQFQDIHIADMLNSGCSLFEILNYYYNTDGRLDVNCMNSVIFKFLQTGNDFEGAWKFMIQEHKLRGIKPKSSTMTIFMKHARECKRLRTMIQILNSFAELYRLESSPALRTMMQSLLTDNITLQKHWIPPILTFVYIRHFRSSINNFQRKDVLLKQLAHKFNVEFDDSLLYENLNNFDKRIFDALNSVVIRDPRIDFDELDENEWMEKITEECKNALC
ncbi:hypothetical protein KL930_003993 [Ogataea haglerorum]|uniref:Uncharacterized protein n=1 Tax=Ogataea haglerorum TaxID=1937702 RepID=A0AAN6I2C7_9ASCO|nr:uncharacterized protein KL911_001338 [Ogataea haglerorum]KAG7693403.1 hypothetical protein KL915_004302 [Ogataea haglerorum]KAG7711914.1 hypothetical protein KL914_000556 [Ogataea haglerorum]KAG7712685.1 hypothetical protein KL950_000556 [Ogataea haglerorum]KAG7722736.1 hypothetical protein KL913_000556 [Ogataea haglerorum]KAG7723163.1 hypothetical protein KL949_000213 [Ogataea haglerorum]